MIRQLFVEFVKTERKILLKKSLNERIKAVEVNPRYEITAAEMNEICRTSAGEFDLISKAFLFGYLQGTVAEKQAKKARKAV